MASPANVDSIPKFFCTNSILFYIILQMYSLRIPSQIYSIQSLIHSSFFAEKVLVQRDRYKRKLS